MKKILLLEILFLRCAAFVPSDFPKERVPGKCQSALNASIYDCGEKCVTFDKLRDCQIDCADGSDEICPSNYVLCDTSNGGCGQCLDSISAITKCLDRRYSRLCGTKDAVVKCRSTLNCVFNDWVLDGRNDCFDNSDEDPCYVNKAGCDTNAACAYNGQNVTCKCKTGYFGDGKICSQIRVLSDTTTGPEKRIPGNCSSSPLQFDCGNQCISIYQFRDCVNDCPNGEDEACFTGSKPCGKCRCVNEADYNIECRPSVIPVGLLVNRTINISIWYFEELETLVVRFIKLIEEILPLVMSEETHSFMEMNLGGFHFMFESQ